MADDNNLKAQARGLAELAQGAIDRENFDAAIVTCTEAIALDPGCINAYFSRGVAYVAKGDIDRAFADFTKVIELEPNNVEAYNNLGGIHTQRKENNQAIKMLSEAIRINPGHASAYYNRGNSYANKGEYDKAIADYDEALRLNPNLVGTYPSRALAIAQRDAQKDAEKYKKQYDERLNRELSKLLNPKTIVGRFKEREEDYTIQVKNLDKQAWVVAVGVVLFILITASGALWTIIAFENRTPISLRLLLPATLGLISYPLFSQLRHMRESRNRLEICREDYFRKGIIAEYILVAGISDGDKRQEAIAKFQNHLGERSAAEFLSDWGNPTDEEDRKTFWREIIETSPVVQTVKDD